MSTYIGTTLHSTCRFYATTGAAADPASVTCTARTPAGADVACAVTKLSTGVYEATLDTTGMTEGTVRLVWEGQGGDADVVTVVSERLRSPV